MADAVDCRDDKLVQASKRLRNGLKSCRKMVDTYGFMLRQHTDPIKGRD